MRLGQEYFHHQLFSVTIVERTLLLFFAGESTSLCVPTARLLWSTLDLIIIFNDFDI